MISARRPEPHLPKKPTREQYIRWLQWNDPNGVYSDMDSDIAGYPRLTFREAQRMYIECSAHAETGEFK